MPLADYHLGAAIRTQHAPRNAALRLCCGRQRKGLERAVDKAELPKLEGGDWHPLRRKWATERRAFPMADVMALGGWKDDRSLKNFYMKTDARTMLLVASTTTKLRKHAPAK